MWRIRLYIVLALLFLLVVPMPAAAQGSAAVVVAAGEKYRGNLVTFTQPIIIFGEVEGDVTSWTGSISIYGSVHGDVVSYTGTIILATGSVVTGNVLSFAGGVAIEPQTELHGTVIGSEPLTGSALATAFVGMLSGQMTVRRWLPRGISSVLGALITTFLCVALAMIWPRRTAGIGRTLRAAPLRSGLVGLLSTVLVLLVLPFIVGLLALSLAGFLLLLPLIVLLQFPYALGLTGVARAIAAAWSPTWALKPPLAAAFGALVVLTPLVILSLFAPGVAVVAGYVVASWGLGAALISRGGALPIWRDTLRLK